MQIRVDNGTNFNFTGIKMTSKNRADATALLNQYLQTPTLELRDSIFKILDPYIQRFAKKVAGNEYYADDVLQNMRMNLLDLLDWEQAKQRKLDQYLSMITEAEAQHKWRLKKQLLAEYNSLPQPVKTARDLKKNLFHNMEHTQDARIPQTDEKIVWWRSLPHNVQEKLIPADRLTRQDAIETADFFIKESKMTPYERNVLCLFGKDDMDLDEIADMYNLTPKRVRQIKNKAVKIIQRKFNIGKEGKEYHEKFSGQKTTEVASVGKNLDLKEESDIIDLGAKGEKLDVWVDDNHFMTIIN